MKLLVVGGGGREHAIIKKLKENPAVETIFALPGNGGIAADATCVNIGAKDLDGIVAFAKENAIDYAVVAPERATPMPTVSTSNSPRISLMPLRLPPPLMKSSSANCMFSKF